MTVFVSALLLNWDFCYRLFLKRKGIQSVLSNLLELKYSLSLSLTKLLNKRLRIRLNLFRI